jgi:hypothetical protein
VPTRPRALGAFDLDGTLLRGPTVCELAGDSSSEVDLLGLAREILERWP